MKQHNEALPDKKHRGGKVRKYVLRALLLFFTLVLMLVIALYAFASTVAHGPSEAVRNTLVLSAMQASATKWVPGLFLSQNEVDAILADSAEVMREVVSFEDYKNTYTDGSFSQGDKNDGTGATENADEWADAVNGMKLTTFSANNFQAYVLLVRDPSRVYVATSSSFSDPEVPGKDVYAIAAQEGCVAAINGGEFSDPGGVGDGNVPIGLTYSRGELVWNQSTQKSFIGLDKSNRLVVLESITAARARELGIRDGVCFQTTAAENVLITNDGVEVTIHRHDGDRARSQRTAVGQRADGTLIFLVTDGRTASSPGATYNDVTDIMVRYGAVTAGMLDGGSSSMLYYEKFYEVYSDDYNYDELDRFQKRGLVNRYKAFTLPRQLPTYFCIGKEG